MVHNFDLVFEYGSCSVLAGRLAVLPAKRERKVVSSNIFTGPVQPMSSNHLPCKMATRPDPWSREVA